MANAQTPPPAHPPQTRATLRHQLLARRREWTATAEGQQAQDLLQTRVLEVLRQLEPQCLGLYWPMEGEFNPRPAALRAQQEWSSRLALPWARRNPREMDFRPWDGQEPTARDECGIPGTEGAPVVPDVVLVPCLGFTADGFRLGYGGGYFDRYLAAHPHVTAIGVAWSCLQIGLDALCPQPHDMPLMAVVTERATLGG